MALFPPERTAEGRIGSAVGTAVERTKMLGLVLWSHTSRRLRLAGAFLFFILVSIWLSVQFVPLPEIRLDYGSGAGQWVDGPFDPTKLALLIENRPQAMLAPLMLHFISVVPPDWKFQFMGSEESVAHINQSMAIREQVRLGKLDLTYIPANMSTAGQEMISRFLTTLWLYETVLRPAENLLIFQTDSILCANSKLTLDDYLDYDWVGAPWDPNGQGGGNGGLSLRRVSAIVEILRHQERVDGSEPEDVWLSQRLQQRPGARMCNGTLSLKFSGEMHKGLDVHVDGAGGGDNNNNNRTEELARARQGEYVPSVDGWRDGFYEPMGFHTGGSGKYLHSGIWGSPAKRKHMWEYCPEVKMTLAMDAAKFVPGNCHGSWKRSADGGWGVVVDGGELVERDVVEARYPWGSETIDGVEYPMLPPGLVPW